MWLEPDDFPEFEIIGSRLVAFLLITTGLVLIFLALLFWWMTLLVS